MRFLYLLLIITAASSCNINSYIMLRDSKNTEYSVPPVNENFEYRIAPDDVVRFRLLTDDGFPLIDPTTATEMGSDVGSVQLTVEYNGMIRMPYLGRINISGLTFREAEAMLEEKYSEYFRKPYVILSVLNKRVIVSTGGGSTAQVITLDNNNTTVMEALALAGGISERGNTKKIKLIRKVGDRREVYKIDLSRVEGMEMGDIVVQSEDIIYVEPNKRYITEILREAAPYFTILSTVFLIISFNKSINSR